MGYRLTSPRFKVSENDVEAVILPALARRGWRADRLHVGKYRTMDLKRIVTMHPQGTPDYVCSHSRYPSFYLETKRPKAELQQAQEFKKREIEQGWHIPVLKADSLRELAEFLYRHEKVT